MLTECTSHSHYKASWNSYKLFFRSMDKIRRLHAPLSVTYHVCCCHSSEWIPAWCERLHALLLGVIPLALVLGATAAQKDFSLLEVPLLTGLNFAGGSEFAVLEAWTDPPHLLTLIFITFLINSRYILLGATLVPYLRHLPNRKVFTALFFMVDESWAFSLTDAQRRLAQFGLRHAFSMAYYAGLCLCCIWLGSVLPR